MHAGPLFRVGKFRVYVGHNNVSSYYFKKPESAFEWLQKVLDKDFKAVMEDHPESGYCIFSIESQTEHGNKAVQEIGTMYPGRRFHFVISRTLFNNSILEGIKA